MGIHAKTLQIAGNATWHDTSHSFCQTCRWVCKKFEMDVLTLMVQGGFVEKFVTDLDRRFSRC